jgi:hypothetical protein
MSRSKIVIPRDVLLVEIERRCSHPDCGARARIGLTKMEARAYCGFECEGCERWNDDVLAERDVPEWWEELAVTGLHAIRANRTCSSEETGELITRMSNNYRDMKKG